MIMDLPERFFIGNAEQKNDAFVEDGVLKIRKEASYRYVIFELTFKLKGENISVDIVEKLSMIRK